MPVVWSNTDNAAMDGINMMGYGRAGVGKTKFIRTMPRPLIISSERGNLSLKGSGIPVAYVANGLDLKEVYEWIRSEAAKNAKARTVDSVALDSLSDIAATMLKLAKGVNVNNMQKAYGDIADITIDYMKKFRDLPNLNKYFVAQRATVKNEATGTMQYVPDFPGRQIGQQAPYVFDIVAHFDVWEDPETKTRHHFIQVQPDQYYDAKDRSGVLEKIEPPDFAHLMNKINGVQP